MKKLISALSLLLVFTFGATAQNRSIDFEKTKAWQEIVDKAKAEDKLIFVDCYTDWCGPCKMLSANVFTQDDVADFFNKNFVNAKFEMEQDADGVAHRDVWGIRAFPTLIFVDPQTEKVVHRLVGAGQADWLIEGGSTAMDPGKNLNSLVERYEEGDRSEEFIMLYLTALKTAYMTDEQAKVAGEYMSGMTLDQLATPKGWKLISENITDPFSKPLRTVVANTARFYDIDGVEPAEVDQHINNSLLGVVNPFLARNAAFDRARYEEVTGYYKDLDFPGAKTAVVFLNTADKADRKDWAGVLGDIAANDGGGILEGRISAIYQQTFIPMLGLSNDADVIGKGIGMLDAKIAQAGGEDVNSLYTKAGYSAMKASLYKAAGDTSAAEKADAEAKEFGRRGQEAAAQSGAAIRMN